MNDSNPDSKPSQPVRIILDGEQLELPNDELTPEEIIRHARLDPATNGLAAIDPVKRLAGKRLPVGRIKVKPLQEFTAIPIGPMPVS